MRKDVLCKICGFNDNVELMDGVKDVKVYSTPEEYNAVTHPPASTLTRCRKCGAIMAIDQFMELPEPYSIPNHCHPLV